MENLVKITAVLHEDKGLELKHQTINVVKENDKALVLDTDDFTTVYKGEKDSEYRDFVDSPKINIPISLGKVIEVSGYFSNLEFGGRIVREAVNKYLTEKREYYDQLIILFDNQK